MEEIKGLVDKKSWEEWERNNKDSYGKACIDCARTCMKYLDENPTKLVNGYDEPNTAFKIICNSDKEGITGAMASFVIHLVRQHHERGEEFYKSYVKLL